MFTGHTIRRLRIVERGLAALVLAFSVGFAAPASARAAPLPGWQEQESETLYQRALALNLRGEWEDAMELFRRIAASSSAHAAEGDPRQARGKTASLQGAG